MNIQKERFDSLTGLRAIFIIIVVLFHTYDVDALYCIPGISYIKTYGGFFGNYMFFLLSGMMIAYNYGERIRNKEVCFKDYLWKRILKIYPLFLITNLTALMIGYTIRSIQIPVL